MKIGGGSGLIGSKVVGILGAEGHEVVAASPRSAVDAVTGESVAEAFEGAAVVIDASNPPAFEDARVASGAAILRSADHGEAVSIRDGCGHIRAVSSVKHPRRRECDDCVKMGAEWVHLRTCQTCGGTRCCDSSPNRHASRHAAASRHPIICSAEPGERWLYCYPDDEAVAY